VNWCNVSDTIQNGGAVSPHVRTLSVAVINTLAAVASPSATDVAPPDNVDTAIVQQNCDNDDDDVRDQGSDAFSELRQFWRALSLVPGGRAEFRWVNVLALVFLVLQYVFINLDKNEANSLEIYLSCIDAFTNTLIPNYF
jgi:hypothetical protein